MKRTNQVQKIYGKKIFIGFSFHWLRGFPVAQPVKICLKFRRLGFDSWLGKTPGEGNGKPLPYSCLGNPWREEPGVLQSMGSQSQA